MTSIPSRFPKGRTRQTRSRPRSARPPNTGPTADDESFRDDFPAENRPTDTSARRPPACHKQHGATEPRSAIFFQPNARTRTLLHGLRKLATTRATAKFQTSRGMPTEFPDQMQMNLNETARNADVRAAAEFSRPNLPPSNDENRRSRPPEQIPNTVHW